MRWLVEVSPLGDKRDAKSLSFDADSWQGALQKARASLGDTGPLGAFTIDLLAEGYRAIDPIERRRYVVKAAPHASPPRPNPSRPDPSEVSGDGSSRNVAPAAEPSVPAAASSTDVVGATVALPIAARSSGALPEEEETVPRPLSNDPPSSPHTEMLPPIAGRAAEKTEPAPAAAPPAPAPAPAAAAPPAPKAASVVPSVPKAAGGPPRPQASSAASPKPAKSRWNATLLYKRELEPSSDSPLTYRELAYALPIGTDENEAERFAREQLALVRESIPSDRRGSFVNIAVFDEIFTGKPTVPPLVVLQWKDWKGDPFIQHPRRAPIPLPAALGSMRPPVAMSMPPPDFSSGGYAPSPAPMPAAAAADMFLGPAQRPSAGMHASMPTSPVAAEKSGIAAIPPAAMPAANGSVAPVPVAVASAMGGAPAVQISSSPAMVAVAPPQHHPSGRRVTGDELIADLFDEMHGLQFQADAVEAGYFCLDLALSKIPARAGLLHFFDIEKREFVVACTRGAGIEQLLLARHPGADACLNQATRTKQAVVISRVDPIPQRFGFTGGLDSAVLAPLWPHGRFVGAIEVINPSDGRPFTVDDANAFTYIAEQLAEYIGSRGIVLEVARLSRRPPPPPAR
ncbi:MAG: hypothetical protein U0174_27710 [Polyangiaceae bacterium]